MDENAISALVVDAVIHIHRQVGPGLFESVYEAILEHELGKRDLSVRRQVPVPLIYDHLKFDESYRLDLVVNERVVLELKIGRSSYLSSLQTDAHISEIDGLSPRSIVELRRTSHARWNRARSQWPFRTWPASVTLRPSRLCVFA